MKIKVDKKKCIGCGACAATCPEVFEMDSKSGKARPKTASSDKPCVQEAADNCPVQAITLK